MSALTDFISGLETLNTEMLSPPHLGDNTYWSTQLGYLINAFVSSGESTLVEVPSYADLPTMGTVGVFFKTLDTGKIYLWNNFLYVELGPSVTSVGLSLPSEFTVSNSPVTSSGTLTAVWSSQTANKFLGSPDGTSGVPSFRSILNSDLPSALTGKTYNGLSLTSLSTGFSLSGGTSSRTLTVDETKSLSDKFNRDQSTPQVTIGIGRGTRLISGGDVTQNSSTSIDIASGSGVVYDSSTQTDTLVSWGTITNYSLAPNISDGADSSYILINSSGGVIAQTTDPNSNDLRNGIYLSKVAHRSGGVITSVREFKPYGEEALINVDDLTDAIGPLNISGNIISFFGTGLQIQKSSGKAYRYRWNAYADRKNPSYTQDAALIPITFIYCQQKTGGGVLYTPSQTVVDPGHYDIGNSTLSSVAGGQYSIQRTYYFPGTNSVYVFYGRALYNSMDSAIAGVNTESFSLGTDFFDGAILRSFMIFKGNASNLSNSSQARFLDVGKFSGASGTTGFSITTLQGAYDGSLQPQIITSALLGSVQFKRGSSADTDKVFEILNGAGTSTFSVLGNGVLQLGSLTASKLVFTDASKNLTSIGIGTSSQFLKADGSLDSSSYLTGNQTITLSGLISGSGTTSISTSSASKFIVQGTSDVNLTGAQFLGSLGTGILKNTTTTGVLSIASNSDITGSLLTGYVSGSGTISASDSILTAIQKLNGNVNLLVGAIIYQGTWNASTNTPTIVSGVGTKGYLYKVSVAGTTLIDGISQWDVGDSIVFDGTAWGKIEGSATDVNSVFGRVGAVVGAASDYSGVGLTGVSSLNGLVITPNTGVITTGTWHGTPIANSYLANSAVGNLSGTNSGDVTLATNSGLSFTSGQTGLTLGTPSSITASSTNSVTTTTHTHAITASLSLIGNGTAQNQILLTGATPFSPSWTLANNLVSLNNLSYASSSFVKMTGTGTFSLDTNSYLPLSGGTLTGALTLASVPTSLSLTNSGGNIGFNLTNSSTSYGIYISNSGNNALVINTTNGEGLRVSTFSTSTSGVRVDNGTPGYGLLIGNNSTGTGSFINNSSTGTGFSIYNTSSGIGQSVLNNSTGVGMYITNINTGSGVLVNNTSTAYGINISSSSTGVGLKVTGQGVVLPYLITTSTATVEDGLMYFKNTSGTYSLEVYMNGGWRSFTSGGITLTSLSSTATGLTYTNTTGVFSLTSGYVIPTTTEETNWNTAYTNRITSLTTTGSSGASTLSSNTLNIPNYTLSGLGGQPSNTNLTSLSGLSYTSNSFVKMTGANTFSLDMNSYVSSYPSAISLFSLHTFDGTPAITYPDLPAVADPGTAGYTAVGGTWSGGAFTKTAATGWNNAELRSNSPLGVGATASLKASSTNGGVFFGLDTSPPTNGDYTLIDYGLYLGTNGLIQVFLSGNVQGTNFGAYLTTDVFSVVYDGVVVHFQKNGVDFFTSSPGAGKLFFFDSAFYTLSAAANSISFSVVGTTYTQPDWATVDGWAVGSGSGAGTVTASGGMLSLDGFVYASRSPRVVGLTVGSLIIVRARLTSGATATIRSDITNSGGSVVSTLTLGTLPSDGAWYLLSAINLDPTGTQLADIFPVGYASNSRHIDIDWIYVGDGSYTWTLGDASGNGNDLVPHGGLTQVTGVSGKAVQFDGTTGYLSGLMSGFIDKITVSFWENFSTFSSTIKVLFESSPTFVSHAGGIVCSINDGANGRLTVGIKTATSYLVGTYDLASNGIHHIALKYDKTIASNSALLLFVDGIQVPMTYPFPYSGAGTLPSIYNGPFFVHSRAGASLFADGWIDELRIDQTILSSEEIKGLAVIPNFTDLDATGYGSIVRSTSPQLVTPNIGVATATSINGLTISSSTGTLSIANGKTLSLSNTLTLVGTDSTTMTFPTTSKTLAANDGSNWTLASQAIGDLLVATGASSYGRLADVATGSVLVSGGVGVSPSWSSSLTLGGGLTVGGTVTGSSSLTASDWGTAGIAFKTLASTYTNSSGSGTTTHGAITALAIPTLAGSAATRNYTNASTLYIAGSPVAGTNVVITNPYSLYINGGKSYFAGDINTNGNLSINGSIIGVSQLGISSSIFGSGGSLLLRGDNGAGAGTINILGSNGATTSNGTINIYGHIGTATNAGDILIVGNPNASGTGTVNIRSTGVSGGISINTSNDVTITGAFTTSKISTSGSYVIASTSTVTGAGTTTLTVNSNGIQIFTGITTQTVVLPVVTTLSIRQIFTIVNQSTGVVTVQSSGSNNIQLIPGGTTYTFINNKISADTTPAAWDVSPLVTNGFISIATAGGTTTISSTGGTYLFTGSSNQTITLPVAILGQTFTIINRSTGTLTVNSSGANLVQSMGTLTYNIFTAVQAGGTATASWAVK